MRTAIHSAPRPWRRLAILLTAFVTFFAFGAPSALATSPPVATDNSYSVDEDAQLTGNVITDDTGSGVDSDANGDPLSAIVASEVSHGSLTLNTDGSFTYDPNANYNGSDSFTYTLSDGDGTTADDTATVSITVNAVNDPPVATDDSATTSEDTAVTVDVLANDTDTEGDELTVAGIADGSNGTTVTDGTRITYTPTAGFTGEDSFIYTVTDGTSTDIASVTITVNTAGEAPFEDLEGSSTETIAAIETLIELGITTGTSDSTFSPELVTERWQMALFLTRLLEATGSTLPTPTTSFADLDGYSPEAQLAMNQLAELEISTGTSQEEFSPSADVTRWQMALFVARTLEAAGLTLPDAGLPDFTDLDGYPVDVREAIAALVSLGITTGTTETTYAPEAELPRWQMALFLTRAIEAITN